VGTVSRRAAAGILAGTMLVGCGSMSREGAVASTTAPAGTATTTPIASVTTIGSAPVPTTPPGIEPASSSTIAPVPAVGERATGAIAFSPSSSDNVAIGEAFSLYANYSACQVQPVPGSLKAATISATGVRWAFGAMEPALGCTVKFSTGQTIDANSVYPFSSGTAQKSGVFEEQAGKAWVMNSFESNPFPCAPAPGERPGFGNPWVPLAVLNAVGVAHASSSGCSSAYTPPAGR
jgi:hypothetical protein